MSAKYRRKPLAQFEHGTRIYAPTDAVGYYKISAKDPASGKRLFRSAPTEDQARATARELEQQIAGARPLAATRSQPDRTVAALAEDLIATHLAGLSANYQAKQRYLLESWILPRLRSIKVSEWTPAESALVLADIRRRGLSDSLVQDAGSAMRGLVSHARRLRWLTSQSEDPMWMVSYSKQATIQGTHAVYVPRASLPTDEQCDALFTAMADAGEATWALAMRLKHRAGVRWSELIALQAGDISFDPRVVHVRRAAEIGRGQSPSFKRPKNGLVRTTIFPKSLVAELRPHVEGVRATEGDEGLLFPNRRGQLMRRTTFQQVWVKAADAAGWPMTRPLQRSSGYRQRNKGWRWTGSAKWSPHDLRHVAACWMLFDLDLDPAVVAQKLGHADPSFTVKRYVGVRGDPDTAAMSLTEDW